MNYKQEFSLAFGDYAEAKNPRVRSNTLEARTEPCIALYPLQNFSGGWMLMALAENWQQNRQACCSAKAREIGVLLAAQLVTGAGFEIGVSRVGLSAESGFLAYLLF